MKIRQLIAPSGAWFAMMTSSDDPSSCAPVRVAAFALIEDENDYSEVVAMVPGDNGYGERGNKLVPVDAEMCLGLASEEDSRDPVWQDIARRYYEADREIDDAEAAKDTDCVKRIAKQFLNERELLAAIDKDLPYARGAAALRDLSDADVIGAFPGGYKLTKFGRAVYAEILGMW